MKRLTMVLCWIKSQLFRLTVAQKIVFIFLMCQEMENSNAKRSDPPQKCFAILFKEIQKKKIDSFQLLFLRFLVLPIYSWSINIIVLLWTLFYLCFVLIWFHLAPWHQIASICQFFPNFSLNLSFSLNSSLIYTTIYYSVVGPHEIYGIRQLLAYKKGQCYMVQTNQYLHLDAK